MNSERPTLQTIVIRASRPPARGHLSTCLIVFAVLCLSMLSTRAIAQDSTVSADAGKPSSPARPDHPRVHIRVPGSETSSASSKGDPAPHANAPGGSPQQPEVSKGERKARRDFDLLDFNGDGYLSRDEVALFPRLSKAFSEADTNHDNRISFEEVRAFAIRYRAQRERERQAAKVQEHGLPATPAPDSTSGR
jgi:hypothetical protein